MVRWFRRLVFASLIVGGAAFVVRRRGKAEVAQHPPARPTDPSWPTIVDDDTDAPPTAGRAATDRRTDLRSFVEVGSTQDDQVRDASSDRASRLETDPRWVSPIDGRCPDGYPVKANDNSRIFHVPGGRFYDRTVPERCYVEAADAAADGYRAAKA